MTNKYLGSQYTTVDLGNYSSYSYVVVTLVNPYRSGYGATGVVSTLANIALTNEGRIDGSNGGPAGLAGGIGVNLAASGDRFANDAGATVSGGTGGTVAASRPYAGPSGGLGVSLTSGAYMRNYGHINGGDGGGLQGSGGAGGSANLISTGPGGAGTVLAGASAKNFGTITGGNANEGAGGTGVSLVAGSGTTSNLLINTANGAITGGLGSGAGVALTSYNAPPAALNTVIFNLGRITGGEAGIGHVGGDGVDVASGVNAFSMSASDLFSPGNITGGDDFNSGSVGGVGINLGSDSLAYTSGTVTGGRGYASGGAGASLNAAYLFVTGGSVKGGDGLNATTGNGGNGGAGVYLSNGSGMFIQYATIGGGAGGAGAGGGTAGAAGDAVQVAAGSSAGLYIGQGVTFDGNVVGSYLSTDQIYLSGGGAATLSGLGSQITGFDSVDFTTREFSPAASWTVQANSAAAVSGSATINAPVSFVNFGDTDTLDVTDLAYARGAYATFSGGVLDVHEGVGGPQYYIDITSVAGTNFKVSSDGGTGAAGGGAGTDITLSAACYLRGTRILTERGEVRIEELSVSDRVICASGERRPVRWLGFRRIDCARYREPATVWPICIRAGAIAAGRPARDLWVSPGHSILMGGVLIQAEKLVNGISIVQVPRTQVQYWHVELDAHDVILAEGLGAESYLDTGNRGAFVNGGRFLEAYPDFQPKHWAETCMPLVLEGELLSKARAAVLERARALTDDALLLLGRDFTRPGISSSTRSVTSQ